MRPKIAVVVLAGNSDLGGGIGAWQNPEGQAIVIGRVEVYGTTPATAACTLDAGTTPTSAATSSDNLIDGLDINATAGGFDNVTDKGTNGKSRQALASGKWVTFSRATGASAGFVGTAYIHYHLAS
jgi:hypothetical protein